jgi:hypothetical protein
MACEALTYRVEFRRDGAVIGEAEGFEARAAAKWLADAEIAQRDAEIALVIDVDGTGMEVASIRLDAMRWDDE